MSASLSSANLRPDDVRQGEALVLLNQIYTFLLDRNWRQRNQRLPWRDPKTGNDYEFGAALEIQMKREPTVERTRPHEGTKPTEAKP
jgi:hypothetical protein